MTQSDSTDEERGCDGRPTANRRDRALALARETHRRRHAELHAAFVELLADYQLHHRGSLPSQMTVMQLLAWSHAQTVEPTPEIPT